MKADYEKNEKPIYARREDKQLILLPHFHKEIEIIYVAKGSTIAFADQKSVEVEKGQFFISFPNQIHYYKSAPESEFRVLIVSAEIFFGIEELFYNSLPETPLVSTEPDDPAHSYCDEIARLTTDGNVTELVGYFNLLMVRLLKHLKLNSSFTAQNTTLHEVLMFCSKNYAESITLEYVAQHMHLSRCYISHLFSEKLNVGFNDYINSLRIKEASRRLSLTEEKISEISEEVGFGSIRSFNRAFLKIMGCSPQEYRDSNKTV